jgi:nicotinate phosphoribosyltransferase
MNFHDTELTQGFLFTDQYELTMAQLYFYAGIHETPAQFDHFFRNYPDYGPHKAGYCVNAGLEWLLRWMESTRISDKSIERLKGLAGPGGERIFSDEFLAWLRENGHFKGLTVKAIPEGRVVHPDVPLTVVQGPLAIAQVLESALLNQLNYQTLVATKAARIRESARGGLVVDFGMRRAQELGANAAARAALIGGAHFTSNTGISIAMGYPPKGTHAHSMVQAFIALGGTELEAFRRYAELYPDNCILLVDTINTLESGIPNAIRVFEELKSKGYQPLGVRLDSGDLAHLAVQSAKMLNDAGFPDCKIVLSNQLDELVIQQVISQIQKEAAGIGIEANSIVERLAYGVGTHLVTSSGAPALDGVYKLAGIKKGDRWEPAIKLSENVSKIPNPGGKTVWRLYDKRLMATADLLCTEDEDPGDMNPVILRHPVKEAARRSLQQDELSNMEQLLELVFRNGKMAADLPDIEEIRSRRDNDLEGLDPGVKRIINPHIYHVSLSSKLWDIKEKLIYQARRFRFPHQRPKGWGAPPLSSLRP